jgi:hypothetical protein
MWSLSGVPGGRRRQVTAAAGYRWAVPVGAMSGNVHTPYEDCHHDEHH